MMLINKDVLETVKYNKLVNNCESGISETRETIRQCEKLIRDYQKTIKLVKDEYLPRNGGA